MKKPSRTNRSKVPTPPTSYPRSAQDAFVTQKMLYSVRDELMAHTDGKFHEVKAEIHEVKADLAKLDKSVHRVALLVEEQNNRNKIVLDGLTQLFARQDRVEKKLGASP